MSDIVEGHEWAEVADAWEGFKRCCEIPRVRHGCYQCVLCERGTPRKCAKLKKKTYGQT